VILQREDRQTVVRGRFNPHIINPEWLKSEGIWQADQVQMHLGAIFEGLNFGTADMKTEWAVENRGLAIKSDNEDCGDLAAQVVKKLPHTPVTAVGNNFAYTVSPDETSGEIPKFGALIRQSFSPDLAFDELTWSGALPLTRGTGRISVGVTLPPDGDLIVRFNFHRDIKKTSGGSAVANSTAEAARSFKEDELESRQLVEIILNKRFQ